MKVKDMPFSLREACLERGRSLDEEIAARDAVMEYSGWHLGDPYWAEVIIDHYETVKGTE